MLETMVHAFDWPHAAGYRPVGFISREALEFEAKLIRRGAHHVQLVATFAFWVDPSIRRRLLTPGMATALCVA